MIIPVGKWLVPADEAQVRQPPTRRREKDFPRQAWTFSPMPVLEELAVEFVELLDVEELEASLSA
jgi:hypothetical protein